MHATVKTCLFTETVLISVTGCMWKITAPQFGKFLIRGRVGETYCIGGNSEKTNLEVVDTICACLMS